MDVNLDELKKIRNAIHEGQWSPINNRRMQNLVQDYLDCEIKFVCDDEALNDKIEEDQKKTEKEAKQKAAEEAKKKAEEETRLKSEAEATNKKAEEVARFKFEKQAAKKKADLRKIILSFEAIEADENESEDSFDRICNDQRSLQEKVMTVSSEKHVIV